MRRIVLKLYKRSHEDCHKDYFFLFFFFIVFFHELSLRYSWKKTKMKRKKNLGEISNKKSSYFLKFHSRSSHSNKYEINENLVDFYLNFLSCQHGKCFIQENPSEMIIIPRIPKKLRKIERFLFNLNQQLWFSFYTPAIRITRWFFFCFVVRHKNYFFYEAKLSSSQYISCAHFFFMPRKKKELKRKSFIFFLWEMCALYTSTTSFVAWA